ncbi:isopentenyl-diphosphate delta-isomerase, type 2 [Xanthobacter versatilis]|uniref:Isopentenyl-diphosphate delta-isomerase n=1 Tax=Xanthobacter autotrophicus (strain ATCC BAA-1158 / Py2) TaxID=78245 RepID=IDI2_XANP2|nr:RecName: Full=Isopentenyl-diphosphate delta-isomerase; Short=IPP isomerase; AltName: Full=Isopentenyl diphosphate:dimethylallyl diphosphate isomerase; AltName: Full=Isopentenyl pyrophosphate isomerase; AltName: Full=Type 2 isopentenyl diphosphate isomerase; Short=IDI-2 [Xanthobacter autotrophicus Py2]ABS69356.1 isopentenyl-diphosphate delta-isomerase, type 2 [Xanthobacter autotrophicus Py2]
MDESGAGRRKEDHIDIVLAGGRVASRLDAGFDRVRFVHCALPELDLDAIDLSTRFLGRPLKAPFLISAMTGGPARAESINAHLAEAAQALGIALGVGSQRIAIEDGSAGGLGADLRRRAPDIALFANLGAAQLLAARGLDAARRAVEMIGADVLVIHLNPLQEAIQQGGDRDWRGVFDRIGSLCVSLSAPVVVKEVGFGLSGAVARRLADCGVAALDVAGAGGTNWALVEGERGTGRSRAVATAFADWGIPTAQAVVEVRAACPDLPLIASGGVRHGVDAAKAIRLGADLVGQAAGTLKAAITSTEAVVEHFSQMTDQLRIACFATGAADLDALRRVPLATMD